MQIIWNKWHQIYMYIKRMSLASSCLKISTWYWHIWTNLVFFNCNCLIHVCTGLICTLIYTCSFCKAIDKHHSQARKQDYLLGAFGSQQDWIHLWALTDFQGRPPPPLLNLILENLAVSKEYSTCNVIDPAAAELRNVSLPLWIHIWFRTECYNAGEIIK